MGDIKGITEAIKTLSTKIKDTYTYEHDMDKIEKTIKSALRIFLGEVVSSRIFTNGEIRALLKEESLRSGIEELLGSGKMTDEKYEQFMKLLNK